MWAIDKVGGFEKGLKLTGEDYLLAKQVSHYGRCLFVPGAMVYHEARGILIKKWHWFVRRGRAEVDVIRAGKLEDADFWMVLKRSLAMKLCVLIILGLVFSDLLVILVLIAIFGYGGLQYLRVL